MRFDRRSGVFLHLTSLPGPDGVGDLGAGATAFLDFLERADQSLWQFCPVGPTSGAHGNSPYQSFSAFAGDPLLVDLRDLAERGYLDGVEAPGFSEHEVEYERVREHKSDHLRRAFAGFEADAGPEARERFAAFRERASAWLDGYTLFAALKDEFDDRPWTAWPDALERRDPDALAEYREELADELAYHAFVQWVFDEQWRWLRDRADERGVELVGDVPVYVGLDSADVWANPEAFDLTDAGEPGAVAGVPPAGDDGQRWGNPVYDWDALAERGYDWWVRRLDRVLDLCDSARLDHFKAFDAFWAIPADADDPAAGEWRDAPGHDFFGTVRAELGELPFIVEDLGFADEGVADLRDGFDFPGMFVPHYADWCEGGNPYQPMHYPTNAVAYTSTHDTDTAMGYYEDLDERQRECLHYNLGTDGEAFNWDLIDAVWNSDAALAITTVQDLLGLGSETRFNTPGTAEGNWRWRVTEEGLDPGVADRLAQLTDLTLR
jgi:4-alpha-glucanotransferase